MRKSAVGFATGRLTRLLLGGCRQRQSAFRTRTTRCMVAAPQAAAYRTGSQTAMSQLSPSRSFRSQLSACIRVDRLVLSAIEILLAFDACRDADRWCGRPDPHPRRFAARPLPPAGEVYEMRRRRVVGRYLRGTPNAAQARAMAWSMAGRTGRDAILSGRPPLAPASSYGRSVCLAVAGPERRA